MHRIKEVMIAKGVKSVDLAHKMGKSKQYISNIINGKGTLSISMLCEFADALECTVAELMADFPKNKFVCPHCGKTITIHS